jgi:hypothetical protein
LVLICNFALFQVLNFIFMCNLTLFHLCVIFLFGFASFICYFNMVCSNFSMVCTDLSMHIHLQMYESDSDSSMDDNEEFWNMVFGGVKVVEKHAELYLKNTNNSKHECHVWGLKTLRAPGDATDY